MDLKFPQPTVGVCTWVAFGTSRVSVSAFDAKYLGNYGRWGVVVYYCEPIGINSGRQNRVVTSLMTDITWPELARAHEWPKIEYREMQDPETDRPRHCGCRQCDARISISATSFFLVNKDFHYTVQCESKKFSPINCNIDEARPPLYYNGGRA